jgi:hypothetical protein
MEIETKMGIDIEIKNKNENESANGILTGFIQSFSLPEFVAIVHSTG